MGMGYRHGMDDRAWGMGIGMGMGIIGGIIGIGRVVRIIGIGIIE